MSKEMRGSCLCKNVKVSFKLEDEVFDVCHCGICRNWTGGPMMTVSAGKDVSFTGESFIKRFSSSDWAERGFCRECGTHLFYHLKGDFYAVPVGLLDDSEKLTFHLQIFTDKKPAQYDFANKTQMMTEAEVFAKYGF